MAHFYYNFEDFIDGNTISRALLDNQRNSGGPTRTSAAQQNRSQISTTTYSVSQILQGEALLYPTGFIYDNFNQTLSSDLGGLLRTDADENVLGGRAALLPSDILTLPGYQDALFSDQGANILGPEGGAAGGVPAADLQEAIPILRDHPNIEWANNCFARVESGEVDASILNCIYYIAQHMFVSVSNMKRDSDTVDGSGVSQHFVGPGEKGRAADLFAFGPDRRNGGSTVVEQVINHGQYTEQAFRVIDSLPQPMWPSEIVLGPYDYTPRAHSGINFSTNSDHNDHIHVGYSEYHPWMGTNQAPTPGANTGANQTGAGPAGPGTAPSNPNPSPTRRERRYRQFLMRVSSLDDVYRYYACPLSESAHEDYMRRLKSLYREFDIDWNYAADANNSYGYRWTQGQMVGNRRGRPPTPCEK